MCHRANQLIGHHAQESISDSAWQLTIVPQLRAGAEITWADDSHQHATSFFGGEVKPSVLRRYQQVK